jgi:RHS repeat-associated protein
VLAPDWTSRAATLYAWVYLHQGGRLEWVTSLYVFQRRDYSPTLGRWLENDPIDFQGGDPNLYRFVANTPTNATDPTGELIWFVVIGVAVWSAGMGSLAVANSHYNRASDLLRLPIAQWNAQRQAEVNSHLSWGQLWQSTGTTLGYLGIAVASGGSVGWMVGTPVAGGVLGGVAGDLVGQHALIWSGAQQRYSAGQSLLAGAIGGVLGKLVQVGGALIRNWRGRSPAPQQAAPVSPQPVSPQQAGAAAARGAAPPATPLLRSPAGSQPPRLGTRIGGGGEGVVYSNLDEPGWVVKVFNQNTNPLAPRNQLQNLATGRQVSPQNVVQARPLIDPTNPRTQNWIVTQEVIPVSGELPASVVAEGRQLATTFANGGVRDVVTPSGPPNNMVYGHTASDSTPRWYLIE